MDRPILFSAPMVRALLAGTKQQTRRVFKLPTKGIYERKDMGGWAPTINGGGGSFTIGRDGTRKPAPETVGIWHQTTGRCLNAPYQVGDRLYVREVCCAEELSSGQDGVHYFADSEFIAIANTSAAGDRWGEMFHYGGKRPDGFRGRKVPGMHMPRWASRLALTVTDVRVQRLQEITDAGAIAEGVVLMKDHGTWQDWHVPGVAHDNKDFPYLARTTPREMYAALWDTINGSGAWLANPWVCVTSWPHVIHQNIDQVKP